MADLAGLNYNNDVFINGLFSVNSDSIVTNTITATDISCNNLSISRINTPLIPSLGSSINLTQLFQNSYFNSIFREMQIWDDAATAPFVKYDISLAYIYFSGESTNISSTTLNLNSPTINYDGDVVDFDIIDTTFHDGTLTITNNNITLNNSNIIVGATNITPTEISYLDNVTSNIQTQLNARGVLALQNDWAEQNIFRKGILPCRGTGTNAESDIQIGGNNQFSLRQATSANNIGIGALTLQGSTSIPTRNTGSRNIAIGQNTLQQLDAGNDNVFLGHQAGQLCGQNTVAPSKNIALGSFAMQNCVYPTNCIAIGHNSLKNITSGTSMIVMGENAGNAYTFTGGSIILGDGAVPTAFDNDVIAIGRQAAGLAGGTSSLNSTILIGYRAGYRLNTGASRNVAIGYEALQACTSGSFNFALGFNTQYALTTAAQCVAIGSESQRFLTSGNFNTAIGFQSHYWNVTGASNTSIGHQAGVHTTNNLSFTLCLGASSSATISNECVLGGETAANQVFLTLPNKHRIACNQSPSGPTINLAFRTNENVLITNGTITTINLPTPTGTFNIGARFVIQRASLVTPNTITINAPSGQTLGVQSAFGGYATGTSYSMNTSEKYVIVLCINNTGTSWLVVNGKLEFITYNPINSELVLGGENVAQQVITTLPFKHRIACNQSPIGATINLSFRTDENVMITSASTTNINLPAPTGSENIGAKFNIIKQVTLTSDLTINSPVGQTIGIFNLDGSYATVSSYTMLKNEHKITLLCINGTGTSWIVQDSNIRIYNRVTLDTSLGQNQLSGASSSKNVIIGNDVNVNNGVNNIIIGDQNVGASSFLNATNNVILGKGTLNQASSTCSGNVCMGTLTGQLIAAPTNNTLIGHSIATTDTALTNCSALGATCDFTNGVDKSTAIGYGASCDASNQITLGTSNENVRVLGSMTYRKYYLSMVNPTTFATAGATISSPFYEYNKVSFFGGTLNLPASSSVSIGTVLRFRRIDNLLSSITLTPNTGDNIYARASVATQTTAAEVIASGTTNGAVILLDTNTWAILM